jgi:hypothetical protein
MSPGHSPRSNLGGVRLSLGRRLLTVMLSAAAAQCASASGGIGGNGGSGGNVRVASSMPAGKVEPLTTTELHIESTRATNQGNVLHLMVRSLNADAAATNTESYEDATVMLFATTRDPDVVAAQPIIPGHATNLVLNEPEANSVVLYFFFTDPGESWRVQLSSPPPQQVRIELGINEVANVTVDR